MLPTWGDKWNMAWGSPFSSGAIFTPENAATYGEFLGKRYADKPIIWILGGDRPVENDMHRAIITAMAEGLSRGDGGVHLRTFHPMGGKTSSEHFHDAEWLDFNMWQTGHASPDIDCAEAIAHDYNLNPTKPCLDSEPRYEDHPLWECHGTGTAKIGFRNRTSAPRHTMQFSRARADTHTAVTMSGRCGTNRVSPSTTRALLGSKRFTCPPLRKCSTFEHCGIAPVFFAHSR
jgi:hypothetical protein